MPTLTNWIERPVDKKGSASVRLTYEEDWHSGWSEQSLGGVRVAESRCVHHHNTGIMLRERKLYTLTVSVGSTCFKACH